MEPKLMFAKKHNISKIPNAKNENLYVFEFGTYSKRLKK